jgi:general secretion pathway protein I
MRTLDSRRSGAGFTLPEILVAFLILVMALGVLLPSFSTGLTSIDLSAFHAEALGLARSQIDRLGVDLPLEEGELSGTSAAGLEWVIRLRRHELDAAAQQAESVAQAVTPYEAEVAIFGTAGRTLSIKTLVLAPNE